METIRRRRRSVRLAEYDYANTGAYFVTVVTKGRECLFGHIVDGEVVLSASGELVQTCWAELPHHFARLLLDAYVIMPNHVHGILIVGEGDAEDGHRRGMACHAPTGHAPTRSFGKPVRDSLSSMVGSFKSAATRAINLHRNAPGAAVWQRNYHEHIIRNEDDLNRIRAYIHMNPARWAQDKLHSATL